MFYIVENGTLIKDGFNTEKEASDELTSWGDEGYSASIVEISDEEFSVYDFVYNEFSFIEYAKREDVLKKLLADKELSEAVLSDNITEMLDKEFNTHTFFMGRYEAFVEKSILEGTFKKESNKNFVEILKKEFAFSVNLLKKIKTEYKEHGNFIMEINNCSQIADFAKGEYRDCWNVSLRLDENYFTKDEITDELLDSLEFLHMSSMKIEKAYFIASRLSNVKITLR
jgi:hypothetical protein